MGLIAAALGSAGSVLYDQYKEYFYCDALSNETLAVKGKKKSSSWGSNYGNDNIITSGSLVTVADGQCMLIVDQGKIVDVCAEPGAYQYDASTEPSVFSGNLGDSILEAFKVLCKRFTFGGEAPKDQRIYYFNTKEIVGNKYGTPTQIPFRVVDKNIGLDMDISISCFGEYSFRLSNPLLFYTNVCGNITKDYTVSQLQGQMRTELLTALQPAFSRISDLGIRYSSLPGHTTELADALNAELSIKWREFRGIEIVSIGVSSVKANEEDEKLIKELQRNAAFKNPAMAAAHLVGAQASAMQAAAANESAGAAMGFVGMNMAASSGGIQAQALYELGQSTAGKDSSENTWVCPNCGKNVSGKFCPECGTKKPEPVVVVGWECPNCRSVNKGKFCSECGCRKPQDAPLYRCDKCGWEPDDPANPPKFCPECGDIFDESDRIN